MFSKDWTKNKCSVGKRVRDNPGPAVKWSWCCDTVWERERTWEYSGSVTSGREGRCVPSYADSLCILSAKQRRHWPPSDPAPVPSSSQGPLGIARSFGGWVSPFWCLRYPGRRVRLEGSCSLWSSITMSGGAVLVCSFSHILPILGISLKKMTWLSLPTVATSSLVFFPWLSFSSVLWDAFLS